MKNESVTRNVALPPDLDAYVQTEAERSGCNNVSEFFRDLLRHRREAQAAEDAAFLEKSMAGAKELTAEDVAAVLKTQKKVRRRLRR